MTFDQKSDTMVLVSTVNTVRLENRIGEELPWVVLSGKRGVVIARFRFGVPAIDYAASEAAIQAGKVADEGW